MAQAVACGTCRYWVEEAAKAPGVGQCRRFPPYVIHSPAFPLVSSVRDRFPLTFSTDWCGEHQQKPAEA